MQLRGIQFQSLDTLTYVIHFIISFQMQINLYLTTSHLVIIGYHL